MANYYLSGDFSLLIANCRPPEFRPCLNACVKNAPSQTLGLGEVCSWSNGWPREEASFMRLKGDPPPNCSELTLLKPFWLPPLALLCLSELELKCIFFWWEKRYNNILKHIALNTPVWMACHHTPACFHRTSQVPGLRLHSPSRAGLCCSQSQRGFLYPLRQMWNSAPPF